jgi:carboxylesterase
MIKQEKFGVAISDLEIAGGRVGFLLIHGLGGTPVELRYVAQGLGRAGFTVHCPLLYGHGGSEALLNTTTWQDWYGSVELALEQLRKRCDVVVAGGLSVGAVLALHLAAQHPDKVQGTILFSPTLWPNGWAIPWYFHFFRLVRQKWFANLLHLKECEPYGIKDDRIRKFVLDSLQSDGRPLEDIFGRTGGTVLEFRWLVKVTKKELGDIKQPALIFHPRFDDQSDMSNTMLLQRKLGGLVDVVVLDDSYHMVTLDRQRALVVERAISYGEWLAGAVESGAGAQTGASASE